MPISEEQKWHWGEGTKYVIEGAKSVLIINGAAAVSILTFIGNTHTKKIPLTAAMMLFSVGALFGALIFLFCYLAQLQYGNDNRESAVRFHNAAYIVVTLSVVLFVLGIVAAGWGMLLLS
jgi:hypothetical protein